MTQLDTPGTTRCYFVRRCLIGLALAAIAYVASLAWPTYLHRRACEKLDIEVLRLAVNRPEDLTDDQWAYCVTYTWIMHSNYGSIEYYISTSDLEQLADELHDKIDAGPDLATIDWFWDAYLQAAPRSQSLKNFRPTAPSNRDALKAGGHGGNPLSQWRRDYEKRTGHK
ncbi:MAG: hypothetical protein JWM11_6759 [Planctomycetaceae bacterium]|nr:hypothetical protein [Planctomycetaceae bacterium]